MPETTLADITKLHVGTLLHIEECSVRRLDASRWHLNKDDRRRIADMVRWGLLSGSPEELARAPRLTDEGWTFAHHARRNRAAGGSDVYEAQQIARLARVAETLAKPYEYQEDDAADGSVRS